MPLYECKCNIRLDHKRYLKGSVVELSADKAMLNDNFVLAGEKKETPKKEKKPKGEPKNHKPEAKTEEASFALPSEASEK